jgi:hypothetical protein
MGEVWPPSGRRAWLLLRRWSAPLSNQTTTSGRLAAPGCRAGRAFAPCVPRAGWLPPGWASGPRNTGRPMHRQSRCVSHRHAARGSPYPARSGPMARTCLALLIEILPSPPLLRAPSAASLLGQIRRVSSLVARGGRGSSRRGGSVRISISSASQGGRGVRSPLDMQETSASEREVARRLQKALQHNPGFPVPLDGKCPISEPISALPLGDVTGFVSRGRGLRPSAAGFRG